jgi:hypothetical protein
VAESCADLGCHLEIERQPGPSYASEFTALGGRGNRTNNVRTNIENLYLRCGGTRSNLISRLGPTRMTVYCRKSIWSLLLSEGELKIAMLLFRRRWRIVCIGSRIALNIGLFPDDPIEVSSKCWRIPLPYSDLYRVFSVWSRSPWNLSPFPSPRDHPHPASPTREPQRASTADHEIGRRRV